MTQPRAVITGASGFVGQALVGHLNPSYEVATIGRSGATVGWGDDRGVRALVDGADLLINLAGRSVGCRYNDRNRDEIWHSRIDTTEQLHRAVSTAHRPPRLWLNASTATIYRHAMDRAQDEDSGELGSGFSVDVARDWEQVFGAGELPGTRRVALRMAIVLGDGPALRMLTMPARLGLGGPHLDGWWFPHRRYRGIGLAPTPAAPHGTPTHGEQRFSWIHLDDLLAAVTFLDEHDELTGPINLAAPEPATNRRLMAALRRAVGVPFGLPIPRWLLEPGLAVLRQESELLLKSRWAVPSRLTRAGFTFTWPTLEPAIEDLLNTRGRTKPARP
ncbi:epimerase [Propionibacteriaceae bacterium Y1685]